MYVVKGKGRVKQTGSHRGIGLVEFAEQTGIHKLEGKNGESMKGAQHTKT